MVLKLPAPWEPYAIWIKLAAGVIGLLLVGFVVWKLFFADIQRRVKEEHANGVVAKEQTQSAKETGIEATNTVVKTFEYHTEVDRIVKEGQNDVNKVNKGQQVDPEIDAAGAAALCRVHASLCRDGQ